MRRWLCTFFWVVWAGGLGSGLGCGPIQTADYRGEPLFTARAVLDGVNQGEIEGERRAVFGWVFIGGGAFVDCLAQDEFVSFCARTPQTELQAVVQEVEVSSGVGELLVSFYDFPDASQLISYQDATLGFGGLVVYDDRNQNGRLDPFDPSLSEPIDRVIAESVYNPDVQSVVLFREGEVHPIFALYRDVVGECSRPPPPGFSVGRVDGPRECQIDLNTEMVLRSPEPDQYNRALCGGAISEFRFALDVFRPDRPPSGTCFRCSENNELMEWWFDKGGYCDRFQRFRMRLKACPRYSSNPEECWDLRNAAPEWWCPEGSETRDFCQ